MQLMKRVLTLALLPLTLAVGIAPAAAAEKSGESGKPNIVVIMGDDIGMWNIGAYHRGLMAGTTPNLDKMAAEGMMFTDYYAEASCTAGAHSSLPVSFPFAPA
jgi:arylsulfatase